MTDHRWKNITEGMDGAARIALALITPFLRRWRVRWGATPAEVAMSLPGDQFVPKPRWTYTHAVIVDAPSAEVWRWVAQMGYGRGGLYSYEGLENLIGCDMRNADRIVPEWQHVKIGDEFRIDSRVPPLPVALVEPERDLVMHGKPDNDSGSPNHCWGFHLLPLEGSRTRLISRARTYYTLTTANRLAWGPALMEPIGFVMERKMLLGIKQRAEANVAARPVAYA
ncbi:MAG: hypothetical protein IT319_12125 [Anaerolineae bacterium]|nr:hypothetical protein [Anaerolineae bacterium]